MLRPDNTCSLSPGSAKALVFCAVSVIGLGCRGRAQNRIAEKSQYVLAHSLIHLPQFVHALLGRLVSEHQRLPNA